MSGSSEENIRPQGKIAIKVEAKTHEPVCAESNDPEAHSQMDHADHTDQSDQGKRGDSHQGHYKTQENAQDKASGKSPDITPDITPDKDKDKGALYSERFEDVYFSALDGLAETRHVFLESNNLPQAFMGKSAFTVAETGFGTGLNFLALWALFDQHKTDGQSLHFISFEKYPLSADDIRDALGIWDSDLQLYTQRLCAAYPSMLVPGIHRIVIAPDITLTLVFDDVNAAMRKMDFIADAWFLDGFRPSSNPDMWSENVLAQMARLSRTGTSYATFTAAGFVRRGLQEAGFSVAKIPGFGRKREMVVGAYIGSTMADAADASAEGAVGAGAQDPDAQGADARAAEAEAEGLDETLGANRMARRLRADVENRHKKKINNTALKSAASTCENVIEQTVKKRTETHAKSLAQITAASAIGNSASQNTATGKGTEKDANRGAGKMAKNAAGQSAGNVGKPEEGAP